MNLRSIIERPNRHTHTAGDMIEGIPDTKPSPLEIISQVEEWETVNKIILAAGIYPAVIWREFNRLMDTPGIYDLPPRKIAGRLLRECRKVMSLREYYRNRKIISDVLAAYEMI